MLGYRCCSDVDRLPCSERSALFGGAGERVFDAYCNVGTLDPNAILRLASLHPHVDVLVATDPAAAADGRTDVDDPARGLLDALQARGVRHAEVPRDHADRWQVLSKHLGSDYPGHPFPHRADGPDRTLVDRGSDAGGLRGRRLRWDSLPWIADVPGWPGLRVMGAHSTHERMSDPVVFEGLEHDGWVRRDDTFPSNLALFRPANVTELDDGVRFTLRRESSVVREFTAGALSTAEAFLYGRFVADLRPARVAGLVTGMFLHRNGPRQEIDIEFTGNDTTRMLVNVYFNPGCDGARLEYGARGTPVLIDLGFDASDEYHHYEIDWSPTGIRWLVDGELVHERHLWDPTPVPHLPMVFHLNLWHTRSRELAGRLRQRDLPAVSSARRFTVRRYPWTAQLGDELKSRVTGVNSGSENGS